MYFTCPNPPFADWSRGLVWAKRLTLKVSSRTKCGLASNCLDLAILGAYIILFALLFSTHQLFLHLRHPYFASRRIIRTLI